MKKKLLMIIFSIVLVLSGCGQKAVENTGESKAVVESSAGQLSAAPEATKAPDKKESASASGAMATKQDEKEASAEQQKEAEKAEATATPAPTQKPETGKETKPAVTEAPKATEAPASTSKADKPQASTGSIQTSTGNNQSGTGNATASTPTSAPVSAPVVSEPTPEPHTVCTWNGGSVTQNATCASEGTTTYTCTVCGNTKTESIARTSHNYVTETTEATCTTGGGSKTYCSSCGDVQSETSTGGGLGHDFQITFWNTKPTCSGEAYYRLICSRCGENGGDGTAPPLGHSPVDTEICHGDCSTETIVVTSCRDCGLELGRNSWYEDDHDWVAGSDEEWDPVSHAMVQVTFTYCSRCGKIQ